MLDPDPTLETAAAPLLMQMILDGVSKELDEVQADQGDIKCVRVAPEVVHQLAHHFRASHYNAVDFHEQVLAALADHVTNLLGAQACGRDGSLVFESVWETYSPLVVRHSDAAAGPLTSLKQLSTAPVAAHHPGTYGAYVMAFALASAAWELHMSPDPLDPRSGRRLRKLLFEVGAGPRRPKELVRDLLSLRHGDTGGAPLDSPDDSEGLSFPIEHLCKSLWTA